MSKKKKPSRWKHPREQEIAIHDNIERKIKAALTPSEFEEWKEYIAKRINAAKAEATDDAIEYTWAIFMRVVRDKLHFGRKRLGRLWDDINDYTRLVNKNKKNLDMIVQSLHEEDEIFLETVIHGSDDPVVAVREE